MHYAWAHVRELLAATLPEPPTDGFHRIAHLDWGKRPASHVVVCVHCLSRNAMASTGARDLPRDTALQMQAMRPGVELLELPGIGHAPALMSYDQIAAVRAFLLR